jgi:hypothetical protein
LGAKEADRNNVPPSAGSEDDSDHNEAPLGLCKDASKEDSIDPLKAGQILFELKDKLRSGRRFLNAYARAHAASIQGKGCAFKASDHRGKSRE